jgi:hypothetical protein
VANRAVTQFTGSHSFVSGVILIAVGVAGVIGSLSGNLAAMIAALIDPMDLYTSTATSGTNAPLIPPNTGGGGGEGEPTTGSGSGSSGGSAGELPSGTPSLPSGGIPEIPLTGGLGGIVPIV